MKHYCIAPAMLVLAITPSFAITTYTYTGRPFTTVVGTPPEGTSNRVSGSFSLAAALGPNLNDVTIESNGVGMLTSFSFSDGVFNYGLTSAGGATVKVSTGATGLITQWAVSGGVCCPTPPIFATQNGLSNGYQVGSDAFIDSAGTVYYTAYAYNTGMPGTWTISTTPPITTQILPQLAFGGGWYTALYFTNLTSAPVSFTVSFIGDDGNPLTIPALSGSSVTVNLAARGTSLIQIPNVGPLVQGYVSAALPLGVTGYGVFRQSVPGVNDQEAVVLLSGTTAITSTLLFDDTQYITGVAVVNLASVSTTISVSAYDNQGHTLGTSSIPLAANAKTAVVLRDLPGLAGVAGALGSVDLTASIGNLAVLGLRFNGLAFTSIPTSDQ
jgi:hypothetical protein